jgi:hypothetical protein
MKLCTLRITGLYALRPFGARLPQNRSRASPFVRFCSSTFFCARKNASHFSLSGTKKRRIQPERYTKAQFDFNIYIIFKYFIVFYFHDGLS